MSSEFDNNCVCTHHAFNHLLVNDGSGRIACTVEGCGCIQYCNAHVLANKPSPSKAVN
jgi:hypothetical protein